MGAAQLEPCAPCMPAGSCDWSASPPAQPAAWPAVRHQRCMGPCPPACAGLNRLAHFLALEVFDHSGTLLRSTIYFVMYYSFASPR